MAMSNMHDALWLRGRCGVQLPQFDTEFEPATGTLFGYMNPRGTPCFSLGLLKDIRKHDAALEANGGRVEVDGTWHPVRYYVGASRIPKVYNLGGDLGL